MRRDLQWGAIVFRASPSSLRHYRDRHCLPLPTSSVFSPGPLNLYPMTWEMFQAGCCLLTSCRVGALDFAQVSTWNAFTSLSVGQFLPILQKSCSSVPTSFLSSCYMGNFLPTYFQLEAIASFCGQLLLHACHCIDTLATWHVLLWSSPFSFSHDLLNGRKPLSCSWGGERLNWW